MPHNSKLEEELAEGHNWRTTEPEELYVKFFIQTLDKVTREYEFSDDLVSTVGFWTLFSDGSLTWSEPTGFDMSVGPKPFGKERSEAYEGHNFEDFSAIQVDFDDRYGGGGTGSNGRDITSFTTSSFRKWLSDEGFSGPGITNDSAVENATYINKIRQELLPGEDLHVAVMDDLDLKNPDRTREIQAALGLDDERVNRWLSGNAHPRITADDLTTLYDQEDIQSGNISRLGPGGVDLPRGANVEDLLTGGTGEETFTPGTSLLNPDAAPGVFDPDGKTDESGDTREELRRFVDSDFRLSFNAMLNTFRDSGTSRIFVEWLTQQFPRFIGEFEGQQAQMAIEGTVPSGTFGGMLHQKGLLGPEYADLLGAGPSRIFSEFTAGRSGGDPALAEAPVATDEASAPRTALDEVRGEGGNSSTEFTDLIVGKTDLEAIRGLR